MPINHRFKVARTLPELKGLQRFEMGDSVSDGGAREQHGWLPAYDGAAPRVVWQTQAFSDTWAQIPIRSSPLSPTSRMHAQVIDNDSQLLPLQWLLEIQPNPSQSITIVHPGPRILLDAEGDGRHDLSYNLYNGGGDDQWHLIVINVSSGIARHDYARRYLHGMATAGANSWFRTPTSRQNRQRSRLPARWP